MAQDNKRLASELTILDVESSKLLLPGDIGSKLENLISSDIGTLVSVHGPSPYVPDYGAGYFSYGAAHGIFHALLDNGRRDILLAHTGGFLRVYEGWNRTWRNLIGPIGSGADLEYTLPNDDNPRIPTQFELGPNGIIIVPQEGTTAFFYNGDIISYLGYNTIPSPPTLQGPLTTAVPNDNGYFGNAAGYALGDLNPDFGDGRLGTLDQSVGTASGQGCLLSGAYYGAYQHIDMFGNLSPLSGNSNVVTWDREYQGSDVDHYRKEILWAGITRGRQGTIGRQLVRSKDTRNSGSNQLYVVSGNAGTGIGTSGSFATIPDNICSRFPDNVPDEQLVLGAPNVIPIPAFKLSRIAFGRNWIGGIRGDQGKLIGSMVGRWGTFTDEHIYYPDPSGGELSGLWQTSGGLVVFTNSSTYALVASEDGLRYKSIPISKTVGCVAADTIQNLPDGRIIWLGNDGFYTFDGTSIACISDEGQLDIREYVQRINKARVCQSTARFDPASREYRCHVPYDASNGNAYCFVFDPIKNGWRHRTGIEQYVSMCITKDHRSYLLGIGPVTDINSVTRSGVWVVDHENISFTPGARTTTIETPWLRAMNSNNRASPKRLQLWFRETSTGTVTIKAFRDWKYIPSAPSDSNTAPKYATDDTSPVYNTFLLGSGATWQRRRPFWTHVDFYLPAVETFKLQISSTGDVELLGFIVDETPHVNSGRSPT